MLTGCFLGVGSNYINPVQDLTHFLTFRPPWPTLPGPRRQPLGGSISLKFLLETRLQSESFDTLDDLLGFRVEETALHASKVSSVSVG